MRNLSFDLLLPALIASLALCIIGILAIDVSIPDEFVQCEPATLNLTNSKGNVSILIRKFGAKKPHVNISLAEGAASWTWDPVDLEDGDNFTILVTDRSPKRKTKLSQALYQSSVDSSNNDSCLPKGERHGNNGGFGGGHDKGNPDQQGNDLGGGDMPFHHHKQSTTEVAIIAGVLGGVLFTLLALTTFMCWRRRREHKAAAIGSSGVPDDDGRPIVAQRIRDMQSISGPHRVVTLYGPDGRAEGQAVLSREGDAGWTYMSRMVPGLEITPGAAATGANANISAPLTGNGRRRPMQTKRYDEEAKDGDLPSYGMSEYERKNLPKYDPPVSSRGAGDQFVLSTRRDSQGSRLTFFAPEAQEVMHDRRYPPTRHVSQAQIDGVRRSISSRRSQLDVPSSRRHNIDMGAHEGGYGGSRDEDDEQNGVIVFGNEHDSYIAPNSNERGALIANESFNNGHVRQGAPTTALRDSDSSSLEGYARMLHDGEDNPYTSAISTTAQQPGAHGRSQSAAHRRSRSVDVPQHNPFRG